MNIGECDFVKIGGSKIRLDDIASIAVHPDRGHDGMPERIALALAGGQTFSVDSTEPHYPQALALYRSIDAADIESSPPAECLTPGPWTPGRVVDLFAGWEPEGCGVTVSLFLIRGQTPYVKVIAVAGGVLAPESREYTICLCPKCTLRRDMDACAGRIKALVADVFGPSKASPRSPSVY